MTGDYLKGFADRSGDALKAFANSPPEREVCRKETLGKDFPCNCIKCKEEKK